LLEVRKIRTSRSPRTAEHNSGATLNGGRGIAWIDAIVIALVVAATALLCVYHLRRLRITKFARRATLGSGSQRDTAFFALATTIFGDVKRAKHDPTFLLPLLAPMGGSPVTIEKGRLLLRRTSSLHCLPRYPRNSSSSGHSLPSRGSSARTLPGAGHRGRRNVLIDVDYGVWLRHPNEGPLDLVGLRTGVTPAIVPFVLDRQACYVNDAKTRAAGYPDREHYRFDYNLTRTANWAETWPKRAVYWVLHPVTRGRVDYLLLPAILEWPEVLLAAALCGAAILVLAARALAH
jgi:hypothetical protein